MKFTKMHGAGNDFVILNSIREHVAPETYPELARKLCERRTGIGADGLMIAARPEGNADFKLIFYNADGTLGEMCGNGARCIARYGYENSLAGTTQYIETTAGLVIGERISETLYKVRLNDPSIMEDRIAEGVSCGYVELGDPGIPHAVVIMNDWDGVPREELAAFGKALRYSEAFYKGANVSFVKLIGEDKVKAVTYERGVEDFTLACGTGAGSVAAVLTKKGMCSGENVSVFMPGGELRISLSQKDGKISDIMLTGPTCVVCTGEI